MPHTLDPFAPIRIDRAPIVATGTTRRWYRPEPKPEPKRRTLLNSLGLFSLLFPLPPVRAQTTSQYLRRLALEARWARKGV